MSEHLAFNTRLPPAIIPYPSSSVSAQLGGRITEIIITRERSKCLAESPLELRRARCSIGISFFCCLLGKEGVYPGRPC